LTLYSSTVNGPGTLTNAAGNTLSMSSSTVNANAPLVNQGTLWLTSSTVNAPLDNRGTLVAERSNQINGSLTTAARSRIDVKGDDSERLHFPGNAYLTVANGFINNGTIALGETEATGGFIRTRYIHDALLSVGTGNLLNAPGASIQALPAEFGTDG